MRTSKVQLSCLKPRTNHDKKSKNGRFDPFLTRAVHIQHVIAREQPIGMKQKRSFEYTTAHDLSNDTNYIWLASLDTILLY